MGSLFLLRLQITVWIVFKRQNRQWTPKTWTSGAVLAKTARTRKSFNNVHNVYWQSSQLYQIPQNTKKYWIFSGAKYREKSKKKKKKEKYEVIVMFTSNTGTMFNIVLYSILYIFSIALSQWKTAVWTLHWQTTVHQNSKYQVQPETCKCWT